MSLKWSEGTKAFLLGQESDTLLGLISFLGFREIFDHTGSNISLEVSEISVVDVRRDDFFDIFEVGVFEDLLCSNSLERIENEHFFDDFGEALWAGWEEGFESDFLFVIFGLEIEAKLDEHLVSFSPWVGSRLLDHGQNLTDLIDVIGSRKQRIPQIQLNHNTSKTENINSHTILLCPKQIFWRPIPPRRHIISDTLILLNSKPEINYLKFSLATINHDVLWFYVSVDDALLMDMVQPHAALE